MLGILLKKRIRFLTYGRNGVATYGEKGCWGLKKEKQILISDIWEEWGLATYGEKRVLGILLQKKNLISDIWEEWGLATYGEKGCWGFYSKKGFDS